MSLQLDIWSSGYSSRDYGYNGNEVINGGTIMEVSEGRTGQNVLYHDHGNYSNATFPMLDNRAELACQVGISITNC